jgi:hypothetical protein
MQELINVKHVNFKVNFKNYFWDINVFKFDFYKKIQ